MSNRWNISGDPVVYEPVELEGGCNTAGCLDRTIIGYPSDPAFDYYRKFPTASCNFLTILTEN